MGIQIYLKKLILVVPDAAMEKIEENI